MKKPNWGRLKMLRNGCVSGGDLPDGALPALAFFPRPAWEYISNGHRLDKAADMWRESNDGENDVFNRLAMRGVDNPVDGEFADLAGRVFGPFFAHKTGETHEGA